MIPDDGIVQQLKLMTQTGWKETKHEVEPVLRPYDHVRDELSTQRDLIFKVERDVIPKSRRKDMVERVHSSHLGVNGCVGRARECIYWPRMNGEIKDFVQRCETCRSLEGDQPKETLKSHDIPERPCAKVGADLFHLEGKMYLVTVDYFSSFWEIDFLESYIQHHIIEGFNEKICEVQRKRISQF